MSFSSRSSRSSLSSLSTLFTSAAVLTALAFAPGCSSGDVPIGQDGTNTRSGDGTGDSGTGPVTVTDGGSGGADAGTGGCTSDSDCPTNDHCLYLIADECAAHGQCLAPTGTPACTLIVNSCACDGTNVDTGCTIYNEGYAPKPIATPGVACNGGVGADGGPLPSDCTTNADCADGYQCGYQETDACAAKGTCLLAPGGAECNSIVPACNCAGTITNIACNGLPEGYAPAPILYPIEQTCGVALDAGPGGGADAGTH